MLFESENKNIYEISKARRKDLLALIKEKNSDAKGLVVFVAGFENDRARFWQESSFYYYTGVIDPGVVMVMDMEGTTTLYVPNCGALRKQWVFSPIALEQENAKKLAVDHVENLGQTCAGFQLFPFFKQQSYQDFIALVQKTVSANETIFTLYPDNEHEYVEQRLVVDRLKNFVPKFADSINDISPLVAHMRCTKDMHEIDMLTKAVQITSLAQEAAAQAIEPGISESEVQASLEYMMIGSHARPAFPSIVATGKNATILHYNQNNTDLNDGELVVVDIGAAFEGYCADLTRTYPVSGTFTKRQRELYNIVLECQTYIADLCKPGIYLKNPDKPNQSLHHLAVEFFKKHNLEKYFVHGIGHYLGLDVHDVGNYKRPLRENDVITIEPGLYLPEEEIGIRIEDNYWVVKNGAICLSEDLVKKPEQIERLVKSNL